jgi:hypothetical protein
MVHGKRETHYEGYKHLVRPEQASVRTLYKVILLKGRTAENFVIMKIMHGKQVLPAVHRN